MASPHHTLTTSATITLPTHHRQHQEFLMRCYRQRRWRATTSMHQQPLPEDLHLSIRSIIWPRNKIRAIRRRHNKVQEEGTDQRVHWRKVEWQGLYINCNILVEVDIEGCTTNKSGTKSRVWLTTKGADKNEVKINPKYDHIPKQDANRYNVSMASSRKGVLDC